MTDDPLVIVAALVFGVAILALVFIRAQRRLDEGRWIPVIVIRSKPLISGGSARGLLMRKREAGDVQWRLPTDDERREHDRDREW